MNWRVYFNMSATLVVVVVMFPTLVSVAGTVKRSNSTITNNFLAVVVTQQSYTMDMLVPLMTE